MADKEITHYHMDKSIKYLFIVVFLIAAGFLSYSFTNRSSCNDIAFNLDAKHYAVGEAIVFHDTTEEAIKWQWTFGDNTSSFQKDPVHYYEKPGNYKVELIVNGNCFGHKYIEIGEAIKVVDSTRFPVFDLPETVRAGEKFSVKDQTENASVWEWRFGETSRVDNENRTATYSYKEPGLYTVKLIVNNDIDYMAKKKIRVLEPKEPISALNNRNRRQVYVKDWNIKDAPLDVMEKEKEEKLKSVSAPHVSVKQFTQMLMQVSDGSKSVLDFKEYFCGDINKTVVVNKKTMSFAVLCQKIADKKISIKSLEIDKDKDTNCIQNISLVYKRPLF